MLAPAVGQCSDSFEEWSIVALIAREEQRFQCHRHSFVYCQRGMPMQSVIRSRNQTVFEQRTRESPDVNSLLICSRAEDDVDPGFAAV